ncbi:hypothetical protein NN561_007310 [Cricetulus griseus]
MARLPRRIIKETHRLLAEPVPGIKAEPDENNALYFHVVIAGPQDSPFEGGTFKLELFLPEEYPMAAPKLNSAAPFSPCSEQGLRQMVRMCIPSRHPATPYLLVESAIAPPPQHHRTPLWDSPHQRPPVSDNKYLTRGEETACWSAKSLEKTVVGQSDTASSDDNYMPTNPVSDILISTMPHHFANRGSEIQPPPSVSTSSLGKKQSQYPLT